MTDSAPIGLSVYSRLAHVRQTVEALRNNALAEHSDLYVFSDAAQRGSEDGVAEVRAYIRAVDGFKSVHIRERLTNDRVANNRGGIRELLDQYGCMIFLEEDVVTAPGFLRFMNDGLAYYKDDDKILNISGHTPNLASLTSTDEDVYFVKRCHPWGMGFWRRSYDLIKYLPSVAALRKDRALRKSLNEYGNDLFGLVIRDSSGRIDGLDVKACYTMAKKDMYVVLPTKTLVRNIGLDGTGEHRVSSDVYANDKLSNKMSFSFTALYHSDRIRCEYKAFHDRPTVLTRIWYKCARLIRRYLLSA